MADALPSSTTSSVRDRRDEFTRRAILVEARRIFTNEGVEALSLRTLAAAVGYSPAALYRYFANKEAILDALRDEGWALLAGFEGEAAADSTPAAQLVAYARRILAFAEAYPDYYRLMLVAPDVPPLSAEQWRSDPHTADLIATITTSAGNDLDGRTPEQVVFRVWLLAHGAALLRPTLLRDDPILGGLVSAALGGAVN